jgi:PAS domain S-box-containing protein
MADVKILLVEDESIEAMDIKRTLESFGYEVPYVASSGEDAIEKAPAILPDLILMDIILDGEIDGIQVANEIEKLDIPVIYLTAHTEESTVQKAKLTDPYGYIIKPYEQKDLKIAIDIAIYKHDLENKLKASENKYRSIVENVMDAYIRGDKEGHLIMASPSAIKMFKFASSDEMIGIPVLTLYKSLEDRQKVLEELKKHGKVKNMKCEGLKKDGSTFWLLMNAQYHYDKQGKIQGTEAFVRDINELEQTQEALNKSEKNYRELVDNSLVGVYKTNFKGDILFGNHAMANIMHLRSVEELKSKNISQFYKNPADRNEIINKLKKEGIIDQYELDMVSTTGEIINVLISAHFANNTESGMIINITERKKTEEQLKKSLNEKEVLLREIHHRVKNNLQIIASLLHLQEVSVCEEKGMGNVLKESGGRVMSIAMVHEKLYQSSNFNFKQYVEKLVYEILYSFGTETENIKVQLDIEDININIDTAMPLGLIINELITNIVKYAFPQLEGTITIKLKSLPQQMELTVTDDGIGLPEDIDIENPETLGLQLVNILLGQIEGQIKLDRNHGTQFKITFKELEYKERL